jgi:hypothetical protein
MAPNTSFLATWTDLGGLIPAFPAAANDGAGRVVLATIGIGGRLYIRREVAVGVTGSFGPWTAVGSTPTGVASPPARELVLHPNFPNPFNPSTTLRYTLTRPGRVKLDLFDARGRRIATLVDQAQDAGEHSLEWNGRGGDGRRVAAGVYLARLLAGGESRTLKLVLAQ